MVSYYNSLSYSQKHAAPNLTYPSAPHQPWFSTNYHPAAAANNQFLSSMDPQHHQPMYYNPHMFHQTAAAADLYAARENFSNLSAGPLSAAHTQMFSSLPHNQQHNNNNNNGSNHHNHHHQQQNQHGGHHGSNNSTGGNSPLDETSSSADLLTDGIPSPPITNLSGQGNGGGGAGSVSGNNNNNNGGGSEISSPGIPNASSSPQINNQINGQQQQQQRPTPSNSPYRYDWMKKPAYASQPNPGKTRTKDKYRVVYTDFQRLELEKEYHTSRYITIRRKTELAQGLQLSERQVKIWFQNRRAKERKQTKKRDDSGSSSINSSNGCINGQNGNNNNNNNGITNNNTNDDLINFMEPKPPKLESGLHHHLSHHNSFHHHQMMAASGMPPSMSGLQALHHHHGHLAAVAAAASGNSSSPSQHMQHVYQQMSGIETIS